MLYNTQLITCFHAQSELLIIINIPVLFNTGTLSTKVNGKDWIIIFDLDFCLVFVLVALALFI